MSDTQTIVVTGSKDAVDPDDVLIQIGDEKLGGWKDVRVTAGIESCPRDFELGATENTPDGKRVVARPGDPCEVWLGKDKVVTGYVNRWNGSISATAHSVQISGRGKCQDLVDCAAKWPGQQIVSSSVLQVAQDLAAPFGLQVRGASGPSVGLPGPDRSSRLIPYMVLMLGETVWEVIERMCRVSGLLSFEQADGSLLLTEGPSAADDAPLVMDVAGTGFEEGVNVESASLTLSDDQRFSVHETYWFSFNPLLEFGDDINFVTRKNDPGVQRYRPHIIIAEAGKDMALQQAEDRGFWEAARRWGQGHRLQLTTDSWRDGTGKLYRPFTMARVRIPSLKLEDVTWMVSEVTYRKGEGGTACDLTLAPLEAFAMQPLLPEYAIPAELAQIFSRGRVVGRLIMWPELLKRLRLIVMRGRVQIVDDAGPAQLAQVKVTQDWTQDKLPRMAEYGFQSAPPAGADAVLLFIAGNPTDGVVIATGHQQYRLRSLQPGEVAISDDQGQVVKLSRTGIVITAPLGATLTGNLAVTGNVSVTGDTTFTGQVSANGKRIDNTHRHTGVSTGGGTSGTVA